MRYIVVYSLIPYGINMWLHVWLGVDTDKPPQSPMDEGSLQPVCEAQQILFVFIAQLAPPYLDIQRPSLSIRHTPITQHLPGVYTPLTVRTACARHTRSTHKLSIICPLPNIHPPSAHHPASTRHLPLPQSSMLIGSGP